MKTNCDSCDGHCCKYVTVQIPTPRRIADYDEIRWFLAHENVDVFIDDGDWFVRFHTPCRQLLPDGRCGVYDNRFLICRRHDAGECEKSGRPLPDTLFRTREQFEQWRQGRARRTRRTSGR